MRYCSSCGHEIGVGRFCTHCGHPVDHSATRSGPVTAPVTAAVAAPPAGERAPTTTPEQDEVVNTAERRAARRSAAMEPMPPRTPPAAADTPPAPRFPLFADEVGPEFTTRVAAAGHRAQGSPTLREDTTGDLGAEHETSGGAHRLGDTGASYGWDSPGAPAGGTATGGSLLDRLTAPRDPDRAREDRTAEEALAALRVAAGSEGTERHDTDRGALGTHRRRWPWLVGVLLLVLLAALLSWWAARGGDGGDGETATDPVGAPSSSAASGAGARDLTATATAKTPGNAPAATEVGGGRATFVAANLLDADPATAWRVAGDATGEEIVLTLPQETTITRVGLVNGYAKIAKNAAGEKFDWYHGNRTVTKAAWLFDDRTQVEQVLERDRALQSIDIDDVTTTTITLRLLQVTAPGTGRASRDFTALSDVSLSGTS